MITTGDQHLVKKINTSIVLETIIQHSPLSRAHISEITGLNKGTVSSLVQELMQNSLIRELGPGQSSGGRKPVLLQFHQTAGYVVGVDLGVNYILAVLTDLQGNLMKSEKHALTSISIEAVCTQLVHIIRQIIQSAPPSPYGVVGIGIGVPGITDGKGTLLFAPHLEWNQVDLGGILREHFSCPITIDNEANVGAIGEKQFGCGREVSHMIYISIGMGIGTGIILGHELYRGAHGFSGEMGHHSIDTNGKLCGCGNRGCWELYVSEKALLNQAAALYGQDDQWNDSACSIDQFIELAHAGNEDVVRQVGQMGEYLGLGIINLLNTFNPEMIVIGNLFAGLKPWLSEPMFKAIEQRSLPYFRKDLTITFSSLDHLAAALGAAYMAISQFFHHLKVNVTHG